MEQTASDYAELATRYNAELTEAVCAGKGTRLKLFYADGAELTLEAETLRRACRCAWCTRARLEGDFPEEFPEVSIRSIEPFGTHAFNLTFSDGHARGVFPFAYLRSLGAGAEYLPSQNPQEDKIP